MASLSRRTFLSAATALPLARANASRPNVLFIAVDDLRPELGCYGQSHIKSPNIDRLAAQGLRFDRAYCQQAVCAPTRASLLAGARPDTTRVWDLQTPLNTVRPDLVTMPQLFRQHGYETISLGKIYHHPTEDPKGWTSPPWQPKSDWSGGWLAYRDPHSVLIERQQAEIAKAEAQAGTATRQRRGPAYEMPDVADNAYPDGMVCDRAISELRRLRGKPFFLAVGFVKPHLPFNAPRKYWDLYDPADLRIPDRRDWPENMPALAGSAWGELRAYAGIPPQGPVDDLTMRMLIHGYYACVSYMDAQAGRLLDALDSLGLREDTAIVLWGDHGWKLGDYGAWCKHTNLEIDTRAPLILSVPGQRNRGVASNALVEFVDVYPTLAEVCGLPAPEHCEGLSMKPLTDNPARPWKAAAFSQYPRGNDVMGYSLRSGPYRYTEWIRRPDNAVIERELYDLTTGPVPSTNLAGQPSHAVTVRSLSTLLDRGRGWRTVRDRVDTRT